MVMYIYTHTLVPLRAAPLCRSWGPPAVQGRRPPTQIRKRLAVWMRSRWHSSTMRKPPLAAWMRTQQLHSTKTKKPPQLPGRGF